ncbi:MAG: GYD domain-containing protein [Myxococcales bacterium]|nr:GYD domain-containing protein [Myxococcales bacterium]
MPRYMIQIKYNAASTKSLVAKPQDRKPQAAVIMEKLGGRLIDFYFTLGRWDAVILVELESDAQAMAVAMADVAGEVGDAEVTRLYEMDEAIEAMRIAGTIDYKAPSS